jgi:DNA-binding GntR family transcriptional regulator
MRLRRAARAIPVSRSTNLKQAGLPCVPTLASIVQDKIATEIAAGVFAPGMHLEENELATRYQVSRTPVREALRKLASLGAVEIKARRGVLVADIGGERLLKTLEVVADLEASCARYAAERMTDAQRAELRKLHRKIGVAVKDGDASTYDRENLRFHQLIHAGSANEILSDAVGQMRCRILPYTRAELISNREQLKLAYREHEAIVRAIESRNGELAYHVTRAHVVSAGQAFEDRAPGFKTTAPLFTNKSSGRDH